MNTVCSFFCIRSGFHVSNDGVTLIDSWFPLKGSVEFVVCVKSKHDTSQPKLNHDCVFFFQIYSI